MRALILAAALVMAGATPGLTASNSSSFTVQNTARTPQAPVIIDGASWRCGADSVCTATGGASQPAPRACRRVVAKVGAVASFTYRGVTLSAEELATCNAAAAA